MTCEESQTLMAGYWSASLTAEERQSLEAHLDGCQECQTAAARLGALWEDLERVPAAEPGEGLRSRFYEGLAAYQRGLESAGGPPAGRGGWLAWWPHNPLAQVAVAASLLVVGLMAGLAGASVLRPAGPSPEITALREEVVHMRQMVALSLLQQQSASERLRGVSWAYRAEPSDTEVLQALASTIQHDENVNVRLAAVDALRTFSSSPLARRAAVDALPRQSAPLVQVALIDLLVDMQDRDAVADLRGLASTDGVNDNVKEHALWAMGELQ